MPLLTRICSLLLVVIMASACVTMHRQHPMMEQRLATKSSVAVMQPSVNIFDKEVGNAEHKTETYIDTLNMLQGVAESVLREKGYTVMPAENWLEEIRDSESGTESYETALRAYRAKAAILHNKALRKEEAVVTTEVTPEELAKLGNMTDADMLLLVVYDGHDVSVGYGTMQFLLLANTGLEDYGQSTIACGLMDASDGALLWSNRINRKGSIFGNDKGRVLESCMHSIPEKTS